MTKARTFRLSVLAVIGAVFFLYAWENIEATRIGYGIEKLRREIKDLENANNYLNKEIRLSMSPERLQAEASRLGLAYPEPDALVMLDDAGAGLSEKGWLAQLFRLKGRPSRT